MYIIFMEVFIKMLFIPPREQYIPRMQDVKEEITSLNFVTSPFFMAHRSLSAAAIGKLVFVGH